MIVGSCTQCLGITSESAFWTKEGWKISKADPKVWMRRNGHICEHVGSCGDDLIVAAKNPKAFFASLRDNYKLRLKGDAPLRYHRGFNYWIPRDCTVAS